MRRAVVLRGASAAGVKRSECPAVATGWALGAVLFGMLFFDGVVGAAHAQDASRQDGAAQAVDAEALVDGPESPELNALRQMEQELFGGQALVALPEPTGSVRVSDGPPAVTSDAPGAAEPSPPRSSRDLSWMRGLTLPDIPVRWDERVIRYLEFFRDDPRGNRFIRAWLRRVDRYGPIIRQTLSRMGLPRDLIFVAMVESGFDPTARSHAGAAGMWQFVERTGEEFDLSVDHWADLRLDPERATVAAGRYLGMLHERFGTWELAFAAYNMGYGALLRSIRKYNTNDYWELAHLEAGLPFETNIYVAKILACAIVAHNPARFGLGDLEREAPIRWETVEVPGGVSLALVARAAGTDTDTIRGLNPALRRGRTPPGRDPWRVRVPPETAERFAQRWARIRPSHPVHRPRLLRFGETLADLARRHGTTEAALRELNELEDDERVGVGTTLLVPIVRGRPRTEPEEPPVIAVPDGPRSVPGRRRVFYRVVRGDEARQIARFFGVSVDEVRRWNRIDADADLHSGMFLQLFVRPDLDLSRAVVLTPDEARVLVIGSEEFFAYHEGQNGRLRFRYTVEPGDTLSEIGQRFGLRTASLARINQIAQSTTLHPGDQLIVYADPSRVPRELREDALSGDALEPGGEATVERTGPDVGSREREGTGRRDSASSTGSADGDASATDAASEPEPASDSEPDSASEPEAPIPPDDPSERH